MNHAALDLVIVLAANAPAFGQTMYKCSDGGVVRFQQMPCSATGGGEALRVKSIPSGAWSGLSAEGLNYLREVEKARAEEALVREEEAKEARRIAAEHHKARAMEENAAAQRETAAAIRATLQRRR